MKVKVLVLLSFVLTLNVLAQSKKPLTVEDLWAMKRISTFDVSPDGAKIVFSATKYSLKENKGDADIYIVNTDGTGLRKLKYSGASESLPKFSPDGKKVFYIKKNQVWQCDLPGNNDKQITNFYTGVNDYVFSKDGRLLLFTSDVYPECKTQECNKKKDEYYKNRKASGEIITSLMFRHWNRWRLHKRSHLFLMNMASKKYYDLTFKPNSDIPPIDLGSAHDFTFSPDGKEVAFVLNPDKVVATSTNNEVYVLNIKDFIKRGAAAIKKISVSKGNDNEPVYSPDGKFIAFRSMKHAGFESDKSDLIIYDRNTGRLKNLTEDWKYSVGEIAWSKNSKYIYCTTPFEINNAIFRIDVNTGKRKPLLLKHMNASITVSPNGGKLFFRQQRSRLPYEIFSLNLSNGAAEQITKLNAKRLSQIEMEPISTFWSVGAGGTKIQSILVKPPFFNPNKKYPLIFLIHGGPQGHWSDDFHYRWNIQLFASKGYVVVAPNPRGSVGYGQEFTNEISKDWGGKVYVDLMNSLDNALKKFKFIDKKNIFAAGASYGGYMINWIEGHTNRFNALVCHDGVFDLESMYGSTEELWFPEWEFGGTPWTNRKLYRKWSPHMFVKNFKTPMLIVHGAKDFRVPETQAFELFTSLQRMGVESKLLYFPDEFHFVVKPQNSKLWWNTIFNWFEQHKRR